jgi:hypothetical protein
MTTVFDHDFYAAAIGRMISVKLRMRTNSRCHATTNGDAFGVRRTKHSLFDDIGANTVDVRRMRTTYCHQIRPALEHAKRFDAAVHRTLAETISGIGDDNDIGQ